VLPIAIFYTFRAIVSLEVFIMEMIQIAYDGGSEEKKAMAAGRDVRMAQGPTLMTRDGFQGGRANERVKKVWAWRWALIWLLFLWMSLVWFAIFDVFLVMAGIPPLITMSLILLSILIIAISKWWAGLLWKNYSFELLDDKIVVRSGVIGRRKVMIPYERIQNVNVQKGVLERIFGVSSIQIETAGSAGMPGNGAGYGLYAFKSLAEGTIQGITDTEPIEKFIMKKIRASKAGTGLGDDEDGTTAKEILKELRAISMSLDRGRGGADAIEVNPL
jgi:membrane protein YdbS with pleckstrin-like domain